MSSLPPTTPHSRAFWLSLMERDDEAVLGLLEENNFTETFLNVFPLRNPPSENFTHVFIQKFPERIMDFFLSLPTPDTYHPLGRPGTEHVLNPDEEKWRATRSMLFHSLAQPSSGIGSGADFGVGRLENYVDELAFINRIPLHSLSETEKDDIASVLRVNKRLQFPIFERLVDHPQTLLDIFNKLSSEKKGNMENVLARALDIKYHDLNPNPDLDKLLSFLHKTVTEGKKELTMFIRLAHLSVACNLPIVHHVENLTEEDYNNALFAAGDPEAFNRLFFNRDGFMRNPILLHELGFAKPSFLFKKEGEKYQSFLNKLKKRCLDTTWSETLGAVIARGLVQPSEGLNSEALSAFDDFFKGFPPDAKLSVLRSAFETFSSLFIFGKEIQPETWENYVRVLIRGIPSEDLAPLTPTVFPSVWQRCLIENQREVLTEGIPLESSKEDKVSPAKIKRM